MVHARGSLLTAFLALVFGLAMSSGAGAVIVYECNNNLCRINPDGSGQAQITTDGSPTNDYHWPSLSRDGKRMAWIRHGGLYLGDVNAKNATGPITGLATYAVIRPDGQQIAVIENGVIFTGQYVFVYNADGSLAVNGAGLVDPSFGWSPEKRLLIPWTNEASSKVDICSVSTDTTTCLTRVASDPARNLADPSVSPDGGLVAVSSKVNATDVGGLVRVYSYVLHDLLRTLTTGFQDTNIAWSSDSKRLVFQRGLSLYTTTLDGVPGSEKLLVTGGQSPSWGGEESATTTTITTTTTSTTPTTTTPVVTPSFKATSAFRLPANLRCLKRPAKLTLTYLKPGGVTIDRVEVLIGSRRLVNRSGAAARRTVTLKRLPSKTFTLKLRVTPKGQKAVSASRTYRVCARR